MIFKTDVVLLKSEDRSFSDASGKHVDFAIATVLDSYGNVFDATIKKETFTELSRKVNAKGVAEFELFKGRNKDGKDVLKLRIRSFEDE